MTNYLDAALGASGNVGEVGRLLDICSSLQKEHDLWISELRSKGFKAAHPNDGWVNRKTRIIDFMFSHFDDGAGIGDLVMLGHHGPFGNRRAVRLSERVDHWHGIKSFRFVDVEIEKP